MPIAQNPRASVVETMDAMTACGEVACQMPFVLFSAWWNAVVPAFALPFHHLHPYRPEHHQLAVPEPIEEEGEHALFA